MTGSARGPGFCYAQGLAAAGATVIVNDIRQELLDKSVRKLCNQGYQAYGFAFDVISKNALFAPEAQGLQINILINTAGVLYRKPMVELELKQWQHVIDTNLTSTFIVSRAAAKRIIALGNGGKFINIDSLTSQAARTKAAPYTAAKRGIRMNACSMATEWAEFNIQSNAIGPGYILTDMNTALIDNHEFDSH